MRAGRPGRGGRDREATRPFAFSGRIRRTGGAHEFPAAQFGYRRQTTEVEKQNRRLKQLVIAALIVPATLLVMGQVPSRKTVEANEFVLKDDSGIVRARLGMKSDTVNKKYEWPALELRDMKGETRIELFGDSIANNAGLALSDQTGETRYEREMHPVEKVHGWPVQ